MVGVLITLLCLLVFIVIALGTGDDADSQLMLGFIALGLLMFAGLLFHILGI